MKSNRRKLLKALALGGGAVTTWKVPSTWSTPVVESVALPAHAQTTERIERRGRTYSDVRPDPREESSSSVLPDARESSLFAGARDALVGTAHAGDTVARIFQAICVETGYEGESVNKWRGQVRYGYEGTDFAVYAGSGIVGGAADNLSGFCGSELGGTLEVNSANNSRAYVVLNLDGFVSPVFEGYVDVGDCPFGAPDSNNCVTPSDRNIKDNFQSVDEQEILERVSQMPVEYWTYTDREHGVRHIGPMAQDFHAAFNVGDSDRHIHMVDANGVNLAAIKALYKQLQERDEKISALEADLRAIKEQLGLLS